jgi:hypothetical protein
MGDLCPSLLSPEKAKEEQDYKRKPARNKSSSTFLPFPDQTGHAAAASAM